MKLDEYKNIKTFIKMPYRIAQELKGNELRLYLMLLEYYNKNFDYAFPSYNSIRKYFGDGWDNKRIKQQLNKLEEKGYIKIIKTIKDNNAYSNNCYKIFFPNYQDEKELELKKLIFEQQINELEKYIENYEEKLKDKTISIDIYTFIESEIKEMQEKKQLIINEYNNCFSHDH